jgi:molecular chaperone GrpE
VTDSPSPADSSAASDPATEVDLATAEAAPDETTTIEVDDPLAPGSASSGPRSEATREDDALEDPDANAADAASADVTAQLRTALDERTRDLQRITAEYANYRKRVDRDRALVVEQATGNVLLTLLPVLDDLDRARDHGDLTGPFASVADQLVTTLTKFGLTPFGAEGDPFDPTRHEAVAHSTSADVTESTCVHVMRRGYLLGERLLRAALVAVADPE